jgi:hypothetical protein
MGQRYDVCTPRPKKDGGSWWHRVGSAFTNDKGLTTVYLDSYPVPDAEGRVALMLFEPRENEPGQRTRPAGKTQSSMSEELDDEIPF